MNKNLRGEDAEWPQIIERAYAASGLSGTSLALMHWHAGRGSNAHAGADVYALSPPHLSGMYQEYTLSALFPDDPEARETFKALARGAELLQMLNRGRQPRYPLGQKPRIIIGADEAQVHPTLGYLADRVNLQAYQPLRQFKRRSKNPRWRDMTAALTSELLAFFPNGLARPLLDALPRHPARSKKAQEARQRLQVWALTLDPSSHLYRSFHDERAWEYNDVAVGGGKHDGQLLESVMQALGLEACRGTGSQLTVYMARGKDPQAARQDFTYLLALGEPARATPSPQAAHAPPGHQTAGKRGGVPLVLPPAGGDTAPAAATGARMEVVVP
ncbi:hypothetical protein DEIPH_ctg004orf0212 [Deinococcus phoenicis]|uniref:Uncharacterized protein n=1 Tax=Deinococcus phoenicis TaxID=1476583 RepID=A0A016QU80_9DEIO|nr:hypothetical protein [Deinococcus phoenicis]EYB69675.1 hypothetical protein DEIPH_ctg004orf0212 [Deinococcus phoenicis]